MTVSLKMVSTADCAYFVDGWKDHSSCQIKHEHAVQYDIDIVGEQGGILDENVNKYGWNQNEFDTLVSFAYNIGSAGMGEFQ